MVTSSSVSPTTKSLLSQGSKELPWENPSNLLSILKSFLFLAGEAHLALLSAQWGIGMREKGAKNGLLSELKSFILWSWTVLSFWISSSLPFSTIVDCKTGCCAPKSNRKRWPHPQTRAVNLLWLKCGGNVALPPFAITDTFHIFSSSFNMTSGKCHFEYFFGCSFFDLLLLFQSLLEHTVF